MASLYYHLDLNNYDDRQNLEVFKDHHFAVGRHPQMPEVFQILSKNISSLNDAREVVIFIADDKRILVNSHFINGRFNAPVGVPHYLQLAKLLAEFIENQKQSVSLERTFRTY